jgi:hypothetical protein
MVRESECPECEGESIIYNSEVNKIINQHVPREGFDLGNKNEEGEDEEERKKKFFFDTF